MKCLQDSFTKNNCWVYLIPTDTYNGQTSLGLCFKGDSHPEKLDKDKIKEFVGKNLGLKYYNYKIHQAAFWLPNYIKDYLGYKE